MNIQELINSGMAWRLEGSVGRAAMSAINSGWAILGKEGHTDFYGNYVPSRYEVKEGTKGSLAFANAMLSEGDGDFTEEDFDSGRMAFESESESNW